MTKEQKLKKIIEKAVEGGWKQLWSETKLIKDFFEADFISWRMIYPILFSHSFAKAFFSKREPLHSDGVCLHCEGDIQIRNPKGVCDHLHYPEYCEVCRDKTKCWRDYLTEAVLEEDVINYYYKSL